MTWFNAFYADWHFSGPVTATPGGSAVGLRIGDHDGFDIFGNVSANVLRISYAQYTPTTLAAVTAQPAGIATAVSGAVGTVTPPPTAVCQGVTDVGGDQADWTWDVFIELDPAATFDGLQIDGVNGSYVAQPTNTSVRLQYAAPPSGGHYQTTAAPPGIRNPITIGDSGIVS